MTSMRVVLDTNVLVSALLFRLRSMAWLRPLWQSGVIVPLISRDTIAELHRVLLYDRFGLSDSERVEALRLYRPWCEIVIGPDDITYLSAAALLTLPSCNWRWQDARTLW